MRCSDGGDSCTYVHTTYHIIQQIVSRQSSLRQAFFFCRLFEGFQPLDLYPSSALLSESTGQVLVFLPPLHPKNAVADIMPVRESRCRLEMTMILENQLEGLDQERSVDAQQRGILDVTDTA